MPMRVKPVFWNCFSSRNASWFCESSWEPERVDSLFLTTWKELEVVMLSEISQTEKDKYLWLYEGWPPKWNLFIKNCVFILTRLNFSNLQSTLHEMQYTYRDIFFTAQNSFWTHQFWCLLALLPFFCFTSSTWAKHFPLRTFFIEGNRKRFLRVRLGK